MPTPENRAEVRSLAECGTSDEDIAAKLQLPIKKLRRLFKVELAQGVAQGNREVLGTLYQAAKSGSNMAATIFWVKARCGWRDTGAPAGAASPPCPPVIFRYLPN